MIYSNRTVKYCTQKIFREGESYTVFIIHCLLSHKCFSMNFLNQLYNLWSCWSAVWVYKHVSYPTEQLPCTVVTFSRFKFYSVNLLSKVMSILIHLKHLVYTSITKLPVVQCLARILDGVQAAMFVILKWLLLTNPGITIYHCIFKV